MNAAAKKIVAHVNSLVSDDELRTILATATEQGDIYTVRSAKLALKGDPGERLACAMILGR
jgi:hypothetical protein